MLAFSAAATVLALSNRTFCNNGNVLYLCGPNTAAASHRWQLSTTTVAAGRNLILVLFHFYS